MKGFYGLDMLESQVLGEEEEFRPIEGEREEQFSEPPIRWDEIEEWEMPEEEKSHGPVFLALTTEDGNQMECRVAGVFLEGEKEYIALELPERRIQIMELGQGEDGEIRLIRVEEEEEQERVIEQFLMLFAGGGWDIPEESADEPETVENAAGQSAPREDRNDDQEKTYQTLSEGRTDEAKKRKGSTSEPQSPEERADEPEPFGESADEPEHPENTAGQSEPREDNGEPISV